MRSRRKFFSWFGASLAGAARRAGGLDPLFGKLLIDCEEDQTLRAVLVGMLREMERGSPD